MTILVDYGNLAQILKKRGSNHWIYLILQTIGVEYFSENEHIFIRLYGGWYEGDTLSRLGQEISWDLEKIFPKPIQVQDDYDTCTLKVNVQLARSLLVDPKTDLLHTFRRRGFPGGLNCEAPPFDDCSFPAECPISPLHSFFHNRKCPEEDCSLHPKRIVTRAEQKLVDTMMTADLLKLSLTEDQVAVVSSDDDLWPGIRTALSQGSRVIHVHTKKGQSTPRRYYNQLGPKYIQTKII